MVGGIVSMAVADSNFLGGIGIAGMHDKSSLFRSLLIATTGGLCF